MGVPLGLFWNGSTELIKRNMKSIGKLDSSVNLTAVEPFNIFNCSDRNISQLRKLFDG